ncbi:MAG TPA: HAD family hydrolase [Paracoccaceae bacterium]|nr:HAD family hydrolase [Paracoccaceae bacterium]HMO72043.1 HAD family hydrolase [Paracoccaceae bacterium]
MIAGIVFDKDGTLFDFRASWGGWAARLLRDLSADPDEAQRLGAAIGFDTRSATFHPDSPVIAATAEDIAADLVPHLPGWSHAALVARMNALAEAAPMAPAVPLRPVLSDLRRRGLRLGLATNDTEAPARAHLVAHGVDDLFDFVAGYDSGHGAKPAPGQLLAFAAATGLVPAQVVMVGDSRHDLMAGRAAGMRTVGVLTGIAGAAELAPLADTVLPDIAALGAWIDAGPRG